MLITLCYLSHATGEDTSWVNGLLSGAQARNAADGITGALLSYSGHFVQVLEGEADAVDATFARIARDPRHADVRVLRHEPLADRRFGPWSMRDVRPFGRPDPAVRQFLQQLSAGPADPRSVDRLIDLLDGLVQRSVNGPPTRP